MRGDDGREQGREGGREGVAVYIREEQGELSSAHNSLFCCLLSFCGRWVETTFCRLLDTIAFGGKTIYYRSPHLLFTISLA